MTEPTAAERCRMYPACYISGDCDQHDWKTCPGTKVLPSPDNGLLERLEALLAAAGFECLQADGNAEDGYVIHDIPAASTVAYFQAGDATEEFAKLATEAVNALPGLIATIRSQASAAEALAEARRENMAQYLTATGQMTDRALAAEARLADTPTIHDALTLAERPMTKADVDERDALRARVLELNDAFEMINKSENDELAHALAQLARAREALAPFAEQKTIDEIMQGGADPAWLNAEAEDRIRMMGERKLRNDANILRAREALASLSPGEQIA